MQPIGATLATRLPVLTAPWADYALLDTGNRRKLERFGNVVLDRAEPKAWWKPALDPAAWKEAAAVHEETGRDGRWHLRKGCPKSWMLSDGGLRIEAHFMDNSKQVGLFPEQAPGWQWLSGRRGGKSGKPGRLLNLFGYTGVASLVAAGAGYEVTHIDASKPAVAWGRRNQQASGMGHLPIRWIVEDCVKFIQREIRRGNSYEAVLLDPPVFGRGPGKEIWKVEEDLLPLLDGVRALLSKDAEFILMTLYTLDASATLAGNLLTDCTAGMGGAVECGEFALREESRDRLLNLSQYGCWTKDKSGPAKGLLRPSGRSRLHAS